MRLLDDSAAPLIRIHFSPAVSDEELEQAVAGTAAVFRRGQKVVFVIDISELKVTFTVQRRARLTELMQTIQKDADRLMLGAIYIAPTVVGRGVVTALNWARGKRPYPVRVVGSAAEADVIAKGLL